MLDGKLFDILNKIAKSIRNKDAPFGGIQIVLTGDFFQLPPVSKNKSAQFAFESESWSFIHETYNLKTVFRQKDQRMSILFVYVFDFLYNDVFVWVLRVH